MRNEIKAPDVAEALLLIANLPDDVVDAFAASMQHARDVVPVDEDRDERIRKALANRK